MRLNIRCCCQPLKIFGTLEVKQEWVDREEFIVPFRDNLTFHYERIILKTFRNGLLKELAVYSDDRPIEFWRQLPEFREGDQV